MSSSASTSHHEDVIRPDLSRLIDHMPAARNCRAELQSLAQQWDLLTILGEMSGQDMDMTATREGFRRLTTKLLNHLSEEILNNVLQKVSAKAQVTVDILIRNLFERTADIGFLATDGDVRLCLQGELEAEALRRRFREYVAKYSVYDNIILLSPDGRICVQLDADSPVAHSQDSLIEEVLRTNDAFVETYRETDLDPSQAKRLIYSFRVTATDDPNSRSLGVLCLCFRFENEMHGIFDKLADEDGHEVILLLDKGGEVLASNDPFHIPVGASLQTAFEEDSYITWFAGRPYLARTAKTRGYQGYFGQGWLGHVLIPLQQAFMNERSASQSLDADVLAAVMQNQRLFSESLRSIPRQAEVIQTALDCTVWNGNTRNENADVSGVSARVLLREIGKTGRFTQTVFEREISRLYATIVSTALNDAAFVAALAIDIMDRNLYERANDCRWWALTRRFRECLGMPKPLARDVQSELEEILRYINNLYTVYTTLVLFDQTGTVQAVSNSETSEFVGQALSMDWIPAVLGLHDSQQYAVSAFEKSPLYGDHHTYIYGAVIRDLEQCVIGGIAIVFDSDVQFKAMLEDAMPRDAAGQVIEGAIGLFVEPSGLVVAAYGGGFKPGDKVSLPRTLLQPKKGESVACVHAHDGVFYATGARLSQGYREFKGHDDHYHYEVSAVIMIPLGKVPTKTKGRASRKGKQVGQLAIKDHSQQQKGEQYATFYAGGYWLAIPTEGVQEAIMVDTITHLPGLGSGLGGTVIHNGRSLPIVDLDLMAGCRENENLAKLVVVASGSDIKSIGILADQLGPMLNGGANLCELNELGVQESNDFARGIIKTGETATDPIAVVIDPEALLRVAGADDFRERWQEQVAQWDGSC